VASGLSEATIRRIEQSSGALATRSVARMDEQLAWFRLLPPDQRSWVMVVAQAGVASFVNWLRTPEEELRLSEEVFSAAPRELARRLSLQQTVELVRQTIAVVEEHVPALAGPDDAHAVADAMLRFSREIAFAAARVYASAAETRGAWDARMEAMVIDGLVRPDGTPTDRSPVSQLAALGWRAEGAVSTVVGSVGADRDPEEVLESVRRAARRARLDALAGVHGGRLVVLVGGISDPIKAARAMLAEFAPGPVVVGGIEPGISGLAATTAAALSGLRAVAGWPTAPRPVAAEDLLPERIVNGDLSAREQLLDTVYRPLTEAGEAILDTVVAYLDSGRSLESAARLLFVHTNTVRYRLRRAAELCGRAPTDARGAFTIQLALVLGRLTRSAGAGQAVVEEPVAGRAAGD
jgi:hypothetical protein